MDKSKIKTFLFHYFILYGAFRFFFRYLLSFHQKRVWERHPFEDTLEKADDLCEIGYTLPRNEIIYKKISEKSWFAEILIPDGDEFEMGYELMIENYIYKKIGEKAGTIERRG